MHQCCSASLVFAVLSAPRVDLLQTQLGVAARTTTCRAKAAPQLTLKDSDASSLMPALLVSLHAASATPGSQRSHTQKRGFHGCHVSIEPSYSIEWKRVGGKETGTGKGKMSCDHSHVPQALPHARNAYASTGPGLLGSSSSSDSSNSSMTMPDSVQRSLGHGLFFVGVL